MVVNLKEQLIPDTFEWTIDYLINKMDLSLFEKKYHNDERGAAAYSPKILLKVILYCYSRGIITSRRIEKACEDSIIVKALAEDGEPDHDTIAAFITANGEAVTGLFAQIVTQCAQLKLITGEMFAIDGCRALPCGIIPFIENNKYTFYKGKIRGIQIIKTKEIIYELEV